MRRVLVVGGVAAGPAAAVSAARTGAVVTLVEAGPEIAYGVCELPHVVSGEIASAASLAPWSAERFEKERGVRVLVRHRVRVIDAAAGRALLEDERGGTREEPFDAVVLATGSRPRATPGGWARPLKTLDDARALDEAVRAAGPGAGAAVLGAGYIGLLAADALVRRGLRVTLFERTSGPLPAFEEETRSVVTETLAEAGVELRCGVEVRTGAVAGAAVAVAALGADPAIDLAVAAGVEIGASGGIRIDERGETSVAAVFAAGDCAECPDAIAAGLRRPVALATVANRMGHEAGAAAAGGHGRISPTTAPLVFRAFGLELGRMGLTAAEAGALGIEARLTTAISRSRAPLLVGGEPLLVALLVETSTGRLLGANVAGAEGAALRLNLLAALAARGATAAELARLDVGYAPFLGPLRDPVRVAAGRAERRR